MTWNHDQSAARIRDAINAFAKIEVKPLVREVDLNNLPLEVAHAVDGAHVYVQMLNLSSLYGGDDERSHARVLRFQHVMMRVAHIVFARTDAEKVDLQNARLHFVVFKPYDDAAGRVRVAVAIAELLRAALVAGNALHAEVKDVTAAIGIEAGRTLAVRNGTKGDREPLFLGDAANLSAKLTSNGPGVFLGATARSLLALQGEPTTDLTSAQLAAITKAAALTVTAETLEKAWDAERKEHAIAEFAFARIAPPISAFDLDQLSPVASKRQELATIFADVDGFTAFVRSCIESGRGAVAIKVLHVIRKELRDVANDFGGRKLRYVGDAVHALVFEGTSQTTDAARSALTAALCAAGMRSSFDLIRAALPEAATLGLAIGIDYGSVALSRVGVQGSRDRVAVGSSASGAEVEQRRCSGRQTAIGAKVGTAEPDLAVAFGPNRVADDLNYDKLFALLRSGGGPGGSSAKLPRPNPVAANPRPHAREL